ncbi:MAG: hypothetical protein O7B27_13070, partial [Gammaproteobacteria bacterium]|nr:hypothetical protein [Gammaproteobacteria bacterium]
KKSLQRGEDCLSVDATVWANTLLLASNWGWKPDRPTYSFMAKYFEVTDKEATALAQTIDRIWSSAGDDPYALKLNPKVDLSLLMEIGAFCLEGAFVVRSRRS